MNTITFTHEQLLEKAKTIKVLVAVHTGYQEIKPDWVPEEAGYILQDRTVTGKCEWYKPVNF